jgi:flagellar basal body rod protein FlgG
VQGGANINVAGGVISLTNANVTSALGYVPVDRAGDTMTGGLNLPSNGLNVGTTQLVASAGGVAIGSAAPHASAMLDVSSTTRGLLIPRMTTVERDAITAPHNGLQVYNITTGRVEFFNAAVGGWETVATLSSTITSLNGLTSPTQTFAFGTFGSTFGVSSTGTVHTFNLPLASAPGVIGGVISNGDYTTFHDKLTSITTTAGHLVITGAVSNPNIALAATAVTAASYGSSSTVPTFTVDAFGRLTAAASVPLRPASTTENGVVQVGANITVNNAGVISVTSGNVVAALGYTPVDRAGDTMTGALNVPANGFRVGTTQLVATSGSIGIGTAAPEASAIIDIASTTQGALLPRMTTAQRDAITSPAAGLTVYNITTGSVDYYDALDSSWKRIVTSVTAITSLNGSTSSTQTFAVGTAGTGLNIQTANGVHTFNIPAASTVGVVGGVISNGDYTTFHDKVTSVSGVAGQIVITGAVSSPVVGLATTAVAASAYGSSSTVGTFTVDAFGRLTAAASVPLRPASTTENGVVQVGANISVDASGTISLTNANVASALGYVPVDRAGDTMTGALNLPANGLRVGTTQLVATSGAIGIGTAAPNATSILDLSSTTLGLLIPRMTTAQRDLITTPANGLQIFNTTSNKLEYFDTTTTNWETVVTTNTAIVSITTTAGHLVITGTASTPNLALATTAVAAASYGSSSTVGTFTVDAFGRLTSATSVPLRVASTTENGVVQVGSNITVNASGTISVTSGNVVAALGYTPVDRAGDTMTGTLFVPANGFTVGANQLVASGGGVVIGGAVPEASAILDVSSTTRGVLVPRVTLAQRNAIVAPADGLQIFNTSNNKLEFWDNGFWRTLGTTSATGVTINGLNPPDQFLTTGYAGTLLIFRWHRLRV